jgi:hypothetical protein
MDYHHIVSSLISYYYDNCVENKCNILNIINQIFEFNNILLTTQQLNNIYELLYNNNNNNKTYTILIKYIKQQSLLISSD